MTSVRNEERSGQPSVVIDDFVQKIEKFILDDCHLTLDELLKKCPGVSLYLLHQVVSNRFDYNKLYDDFKDFTTQWLKELAGTEGDAGTKNSSLVIKSAWNFMAVMSKNDEMYTFNVM